MLEPIYISDKDLTKKEEYKLLRQAKKEIENLKYLINSSTNRDHAIYSIVSVSDVIREGNDYIDFNYGTIEASLYFEDKDYRLGKHFGIYTELTFFDEIFHYGTVTFEQLVDLLDQLVHPNQKQD